MTVIELVCACGASLEDDPSVNHLSGYSCPKCRKQYISINGQLEVKKRSRNNNG